MRRIRNRAGKILGHPRAGESQSVHSIRRSLIPSRVAPDDSPRYPPLYRSLSRGGDHDPGPPRNKSHCRTLMEPRRRHGQQYRFLTLLIIARITVIVGATTWRDSVSCGRRRLNWLKKFLVLPNGIPTHDSFARVLQRPKTNASQLLQPGRAEKDFFEKRRIPGGVPALVPEALFAGMVLEQGRGRAPPRGPIGRRITLFGCFPPRRSDMIFFARK